MPKAQKPKGFARRKMAENLEKAQAQARKAGRDTAGSLSKKKKNPLLNTVRKIKTKRKADSKLPKIQVPDKKDVFPGTGPSSRVKKTIGNFMKKKAKLQPRGGSGAAPPRMRDPINKKQRRELLKRRLKGWSGTKKRRRSKKEL